MQTPKRKTCNHEARKKLIKITLIILGIIAFVIFTKILKRNAVLVNPDDIIISENVIEDLIKTAKDEVPLDDISLHAEVEITDETISIGEHTYPYFPFIMEFPKGKEIPILKRSIPSNLQRSFNEAKIYVQKFVRQYFDEETSKKILDEMESVQFVVGDFSISHTTAQCSFIYENHKIYINENTRAISHKLPNELLVFTLVHEWIHVVRDITYTEEDSSFNCGRLPEAMTDLIAKAIYSCDLTNPYGDSYYYAYALISVFKDDALQFYFFGQTLPVCEQNLKAFAFIAEAMQNTIQPDGISNKIAYLQLSKMTEAVIQKDAVSLIR